MKILVSILVLAGLIVGFYFTNSTADDTPTATLKTNKERGSTKQPNTQELQTPPITKPKDPNAPTEANTKIDNSDPKKTLEYYASGNLKRQSPVKHSKKHGAEEIYFDSDKKMLRSEHSYFTGTRHGRTMNYYENGKIKSRVNYQSNALHGIAEYFRSNGKKESSCRYVNGKKLGEESLFSESGELIKKLLWNLDGSSEVVFTK